MKSLNLNVVVLLLSNYPSPPPRGRGPQFEPRRSPRATRRGLSRQGGASTRASLPHLRNHPEGLLPARHPLHVVERVPERFGPFFSRRDRRVRREGDVLQTEERMVDERRLLGH